MEIEFALLCAVERKLKFLARDKSERPNRGGEGVIEIDHDPMGFCTTCGEEERKDVI